MTVRINVGCGQKPTAGWKNFDNSPSVWLARIPLLPGLLRLARLLDGPQAEFIEFAKENRIQYADATRPFAFASASVDVVYSSHMIEHLDRHDVDKFIAETYRLLRPGGVIRLAVPDIRRHVASYEEHDDADKFMEATHLSVPGRERSLNGSACIPSASDTISGCTMANHCRHCSLATVSSTRWPYLPE